MSTMFDAVAFDRGLDPILDILTPEQSRTIAAYRGDESLRARIDELAERNTEGLLSPPELAELEGYVRANKFLAILQAKVERRITRG